MDKVIVAYWSQTGNTAAMAAAVGEGITEAGKEAVVTDISSVSMDDLKEAFAFFIFLCPKDSNDDLAAMMRHRNAIMKEAGKEPS